MSHVTASPSNELLSESYETLGLRGGRLLDAGEPSRARGADNETWTATGEWLTLAGRMGAEKVFFVDDDPVVVFAALPESSSLEDWIARYRDAWCLARPQCLFLATPDELRVYALSSLPAASEADWVRLKPLEIVRRSGEVASRLARFDRSRVESGQAFEGPEFASRDHRADRQLLTDVRRATDQLIDLELAPGTAHGLIERVLLIRYLEDRGVVTSEYFAQVAADNRRWERALLEVPDTPIVNRNGVGLEAVLANKAYTFAVFERLASDFNGDLFVAAPSEQQEITQSHLDLVRRMLLGDTDPTQPKLFLWAYNFSIVPTSLISSMYEQFFHSATSDDDLSTHYTPPELVQLVAKEVLTPEVLALEPRVLDPSCGSGIFLVEAFRTIVRFESTRRGRRLSARELRELVRNRIAGIDLNAEAVRLAAFSLYLALLSYQRPQDILQAGPLPPLIARHNADEGILVAGDAFEFTRGEAAQHGLRQDSGATLRWELQSFDIVMGNPPWTKPRGSKMAQEDRWVKATGRLVGDRSPSPAFIWRALSLLRDGGVAGLLVGTGVIANSRSLPFRRALLAEARLLKVINFSDARGLFFSQAAAPFLFIQLARSRPGVDSWFSYLIVRRSEALANTGSMSFGRMDRRLVRQADVEVRDYLWKTYTWGSHHDANLMSLLDAEDSLGGILKSLGLEAGCGWQRGNKRPPEFLISLLTMDVKRMRSWGRLDDRWLGDPAPAQVAFPTKEPLYRGQRIIVSRRAYAGYGPHARLETREFSFRHTAYGIPLQTLPSWQAKVILGTLLSSLGRYCLFMRAGRWGPWYDEVTEDELLATPIRLTNRTDRATAEVVNAVDGLRKIEPASHADSEANAALSTLLSSLDQGVYELFGLSIPQRDLINDFHSTQSDLASLRKRRRRDDRGVPLGGTIRGTASDVGRLIDEHWGLGPYLSAFLSAWNRELFPDGELAWELHQVATPAVLCAVFTTQERGQRHTREGSEEEWKDVLGRLESVVNRPFGHELYVEGILRAVTDTQIVIAKRDERRLWTASAAREDVEATMLRIMSLQKSL